MTITPDDSYQVHGSAAATVTVTDDEPNLVSVLAAAESVAEGGAGTFRLRRKGNTADSLTVTVGEWEYPRGSAGGEKSSLTSRQHTVSAGSSEFVVRRVYVAFCPERCRSRVLRRSSTTSWRAWKTPDRRHPGTVGSGSLLQIAPVGNHRAGSVARTQREGAAPQAVASCGDTGA